ncbi:MAG: sensor hybrid histidine kinase [Deltaproteobacteria bacterium]|nr:sensor hybrid histidine kinase [Deltaproteobacteria bacterium]
MIRYMHPFRFAAAGLLVLLAVSSVHADEHKQVLVINSYHRGFSWSDAEETGIFERLQAVFQMIDIPVEYLDAKRFPSRDNQRRFMGYLLEKYRGQRIDLIVALDNPAMDLLTLYHDELFPDVPVVFAGVSDHQQYMKGARKNITGIAERQDVRNTLETALSFHPGTKTVLVVTDNTVSGLSARREVEALQPDFAGRVDIRFLPPSTYDEARTAIVNLPQDALLLIQSFATDRIGRTLSGPESTKVFASAARVPVYVVHETRLIGETVGGFVLDGRMHGRMAADLAVRILLGMDASSVPVDDRATSRPMFDFGQLERFGIPLDKLPPGSVLLNRPESIFDKHKVFALGTLLTVGFLTLLVALLVVALLRLKRAQDERKRAEEKLLLTQHCIDKSPIPFCMISEEGKVEEVNEAMCRHLGYTPGEFAAMTVFDFDPTFDPETFREHRRKVHATGFRTIETIHRRKDGTEFPVEVTVNYLKYKDRDVSYSFTKDITERKAAEKEREKLHEQLVQSQKMETVGLLAGGVAHDFNNLLTPILGFSELMLMGRPEGDPDRAKLEHIHHAADLAKELTQRLLAFSRKQMLRLEVVDVGSIVRGLERMVRHTIRENIRIVVTVPESVGLARADKGQIDQALLNLAINAQDAMPEGGTLTIEAGNVELDESNASDHPEIVPGPYVMLSVSDTGIGMDQETQAHIFEPFFTTKGPGKGTGLGLATVYGIVKQHGGYIYVDSEKGRGSVFKVYLPRVADAEKASEDETAAPARIERGDETVLVAEDNETVRGLACRMLEDLGYRVLAAEDVDKCIELSRSHPGTIHLLLTDVIMPDRNGRELYDLLKRERPGMKVLFMSGYAGSAITDDGILDDGVHFLQKPFTNAALARQVRQALASGEA